MSITGFSFSTAVGLGPGPRMEVAQHLRGHFAHWLRALKVRAGNRGKLAAHGARPAQIPRLGAIAMADIRHQTHARPRTAADFGCLFEEAMQKAAK